MDYKDRRKFRPKKYKRFNEIEGKLLIPFVLVVNLKPANRVNNTMRLNM